VTVAVDTRSRVEAVLEDLRSVQHTGLMTLERARLRGDDCPVALPEELHYSTKLTILVGRQERVCRRRRSSPCATHCIGEVSPVQQCC
jgi:hypothetical protein